MRLWVSRSDRPDSEPILRTLQIKYYAAAGPERGEGRRCGGVPFPGSQRAVETNPGLQPILQVSGIWTKLDLVTLSTNGIAPYNDQSTKTGAQARSATVGPHTERVVRSASGGGGGAFGVVWRWVGYLRSGLFCASMAQSALKGSALNTNQGAGSIGDWASGGGRRPLGPAGTWDLELELDE